MEDVKQEAKTLFADLTLDIETANEKGVALTQKKEKGEKLLCTIEDLFLQKVYAAFLSHKKEAAQTKIDLEYDPKNETHALNFDRAARKSKVYWHLFWFLVKEKYNLYGDRNMALCENWQIVEQKERSNEPPEFIKKLLPGLFD